MKPPAEICPGCGRSLRPGGECPDCSKATVVENEGFAVDSEDLSKLYPSDGPLFECEPCERLVEAQNHHGRVIVPRFCPWCGGEVLGLIGKELDGYRIDRLLAEGGFGILYLASNIAEAKMQMVVKFLRPRMGYLRPELVRVFVEEARLTEEIGRASWNVVRVHNVRDEPWPYFMEEYIRGTTLQAAINSTREGSIDLEECKGYLRGMAKALVATHEHGRVHRDLKPQNVMVLQGKDLPENRVKLLDFGLSLKIAGANNSLDIQRLSASSSGEPTLSPLDVAGTPEYMPPEAFDGMNDFTGDVYSFGVTAYEVLTGQPPWEEPPPGVDRFFYWRDAHKSKAPRPLRDLRPEVPGWLAKVIAKCLEKDKSQRIATAQELLSELRDPIPFWVKPVSAAAIICVAALAYFAFVTPPAEYTLELREGKKLLDGSTLWIPEVEDLKDRRILAQVPGKTITVNGCQASDPRVLADYSKAEGVEITFSRDEDLESLVERRVAISGMGEMKGEAIRLECELQIRLDPRPPRIASALTFRHESSGEPRELRAGLRLRSSVRLSVEVEEEHPSGAWLEAERLDPIPSPLAREPLQLTGTQTSGEGGKVIYVFALPGAAASYRIRVVAVDHAGNQDSTPPVELTVDDEVELSIRQKDRQSYLARGKAFYEIETQEVLQGFAARSRKDGRTLATEVYERPPESGELSSLFLAKLLAKGELPQVVTANVSANQYLLGVTPGTEEDAPFELHVRDTAFPQNELTESSRRFLLGYDPPKTPHTTDVQEASVEFQEGETVILERVPAQNEVEFRLTRPRKSSRVKNVIVKIAAERFQSASCKVFESGEVPSRDTGGAHRRLLWEGECRDDMEPTRVVFSPRDLLLEKKETRFVIDLRDGLGVSQSATVILSTDTRPPILDVEVTSARRTGEYLNVTRWDDLELEVRADEPLQWATASLLGKDLRLATSSGKSDSWDFLFRLPGDVKCVDGSYSVRVEGIDLAGNRTPRDASFTINGRPPVVELVGVSGESGTAQLRSDGLVLRITDGNHLRYDDARLSIEHWTDADPARRKTRDVPIRKPGAGSDHAVSLNGLGIPAICHGEITVRIADALGKPTLWKKRFEMRRDKPRLPERGIAHGLEWVKIQVGEREIYMTRCEVSMGAYNAPGFMKDGRYVDEGLAKRIGRDGPRFWVAGESPLPYCKLEDGTVIQADDFPMVGITPLEAEAFARRLGARLPTWEEWQAAACPTDRLRSYPWKELTEGRLCAHLKARDLKETPFAGARRARWYERDGSPIPDFYPVSVSFDVSRALGEEVLQKLDFKNELFHMIGNVGEIVRYDDSTGGSPKYRVAGGDFTLQYHMVSIQQQDGVNPREDRTPNAYTGFRMVAAPDEAFVELLRSATQ